MRLRLRLAEDKYSMIFRLTSGEKQPQRLSKKLNIQLYQLKQKRCCKESQEGRRSNDGAPEDKGGSPKD